MRHYEHNNKEHKTTMRGNTNKRTIFLGGTEYPQSRNGIFYDKNGNIVSQERIEEILTEVERKYHEKA